MNLLCIKNTDELECFKNNFDLHSSENIILPLMPKVILALHDMSIDNVKLPLDYLTDKEKESVYDDAIELSKNWLNDYKERFNYNGCNLLEYCRILFMGFFQDVLSSSLIAERIIKNHKFEKAYFKRIPSISSIWNSIHDGTADVGDAVLQWEFKNKGIDVIIIDDNLKKDEISNNLKSNDVKKYILFINILKKIKKKIYNKIFYKKNKIKNINEEKSEETQSQFDPLRIKLEDIPKDKKLVISYGSGYDLLIIWPYLKVIAKKINGFPLVINSSEKFEVKTYRSGLTFDKEFRFLYINDIPYIRDNFFDLFKIKEDIFSSIDKNQFKPKLLCNPLLKFQFNTLFDFLNGCIDIIKRAQYFISNYKVKLYMDDYCAGHLNRAWIEVCNKNNIDTVYVPHGGINLLEFNHFISKWAFADGEINKINLEKICPDKKNNIVIVGNAIMENIKNNVVCDNTKNKVIFITGGFLQQYWTDFSYEGFVNTWEKIADYVKTRNDIEFIIKTHPSVRDLGDWYKSFVIKKNLSNLKVIENLKLEDLLPQSFLSVLVGKPGTAGLISTLFNVPLIFLDTMLCRKVIGYEIWNKENGVPRIFKIEELFQYIKRIYEDEKFRDNIINLNIKFKNKYLKSFHLNHFINLIK